jgi:P27 family predicted phage terminase small subunit
MSTPRKSDELHNLTGTKSQAKPEPESTCEPGRPRYPKNISAAEKVVFKRTVRLLESRRAATEGDIELIRLYSIVYVRHERALDKIAEQGEVVEYTRLNNHGEEVKTEKHNLYLKIAETCEKNEVAILDRLGLTPLNRAKVKPLTKPKPAEEPLSEFDQFMARPTTGTPKPWVMPPANDKETDDERTAIND